MASTELSTPISRWLYIFCHSLCKLLDRTTGRLIYVLILQTHPLLTDHDRRRLCKVMKCEKLSLDACAHASQNDRLPLRTMIQVITYIVGFEFGPTLITCWMTTSSVVFQLINLYLWYDKRLYSHSQVLFSEQVKLRAIIKGKGQTETPDELDQESSWLSTNKEVGDLRKEVEKMKLQMDAMQRDHSELQHEYQKQNIGRRNSSGWTLGWRKIRKSSLFNLKVDGAVESDEINRRRNNSRRGSSAQGNRHPEQS